MPKLLYYGLPENYDTIVLEIPDGEVTIHNSGITILSMSSLDVVHAMYVLGVPVDSYHQINKCVNCQQPPYASSIWHEKREPLQRSR